MFWLFGATWVVNKLNFWEKTRKLHNRNSKISPKFQTNWKMNEWIFQKPNKTGENRLLSEKIHEMTEYRKKKKRPKCPKTQTAPKPAATRPPIAVRRKARAISESLISPMTWKIKQRKYKTENLRNSWQNLTSTLRKEFNKVFRTNTGLRIWINCWNNKMT